MGLYRKPPRPPSENEAAAGQNGSAALWSVDDILGSALDTIREIMRREQQALSNSRLGHATRGVTPGDNISWLRTPWQPASRRSQQPAPEARSLSDSEVNISRRYAMRYNSTWAAQTIPPTPLAYTVNGAKPTKTTKTTEASRTATAKRMLNTLQRALAQLQPQLPSQPKRFPVASTPVAHAAAPRRSSSAASNGDDNTAVIFTLTGQHRPPAPVSAAAPVPQRAQQPVASPRVVKPDTRTSAVTTTTTTATVTPLAITMPTTPNTTTITSVPSPSSSRHSTTHYGAAYPAPLDIEIFRYRPALEASAQCHHGCLPEAEVELYTISDDAPLQSYTAAKQAQHHKPLTTARGGHIDVYYHSPEQIEVVSSTLALPQNNDALREEMARVNTFNLRDGMLETLKLGRNIITLPDDEFAALRLSFLMAWSAHQNNQQPEPTLRRNFKVHFAGAVYTIIDGVLAVQGGDVEPAFDVARERQLEWLRSSTDYASRIRLVDQLWETNLRACLEHCAAARAEAAASRADASAPSPVDSANTIDVSTTADDATTTITNTEAETDTATDTDSAIAAINAAPAGPAHSDYATAVDRFASQAPNDIDYDTDDDGPETPVFTLRAVSSLQPPTPGPVASAAAASPVAATEVSTDANAHDSAAAAAAHGTVGASSPLTSPPASPPAVALRFDDSGDDSDQNSSDALSDSSVVTTPLQRIAMQTRARGAAAAATEAVQPTGQSSLQRFGLWGNRSFGGGVSPATVSATTSKADVRVAPQP